MIRIKDLLMGVFVTLFKHSKLGTYSLKKSNSLIFNVLNPQIFIKNYHLRPLKSVTGHLLTFFLK